MEWHDATETADLIRRGVASRKEVVVAAIERIDRLNPTINAVIARVEPDPPRDGFLSGVPFLMKDLGAVLAGHPQWRGNKALRDINWRAAADTPLAARFRDAGLVTLGKTNVPEFGPQPTTQPLAFGPTRNPWNVTRSAGGSSGGSSAAVASGMVPVAHANDGGGSIRIPASFNGIVGLKPSRGRVVTEAGETSRQNAELVVSRTVRDTVAALEAAQGTMPGALYLAPPVAGPYTGPIEALRIGFLTDSPAGPVHAECRTATEHAARLLESLGHKVEQAHPAALFEEGTDSDRWAAFQVGGVSRLRELEMELGRPVTEDDVEPFTWAAGHPPRPVSAPQYVASLQWQQAWTTRLAQWWSEDGFDVLVTPTVPEPPPTLEELTPDLETPWRMARRFGQMAALTNPWNVTGQPAISLPLHWTADGLPVGVQFVAAFGREDVLLRLAAQLEQAQPWAHRWPPVNATIGA